MINEENITGIILVAGNSTRFGKNRNKNFEVINGKAVFLYTVEAFCINNYIDNIIIAAKENEIDEIERILSKKQLKKDIRIVVGGNTRRESVYNCLLVAKSDYVIIHDGARPMIKQEYINKCIEGMRQYDGTAVGIKAKDTIKITNDKGIVMQSTIRKNTWLSHTPQCFKRELLIKMHNKFRDDEITDDCQLLEKGGYKVKMIEGKDTNIKITTYEDLKYIEALFMKNK